MVFLYILFRIIFSMKRGYAYVWRQKCVDFPGMLFNMVIDVIIFLSIKRACESIFRFVSILL